MLISNQKDVRTSVKIKCFIIFNRFRLSALLKQMAAVAALCVQYEADFRPNMSIVVKALQPLLPRPVPS